MDLPRDPEPLSNPGPPPEPVMPNYPAAQPFEQPSPYTQPPPYEPPVRPRGGFNWLTCCGIGCGVLLLVGILLFFFVYRNFGSIIGDVVTLGKVASEVQGADMTVAVAEAEAVTADQLVAATDSYEGRWVNITGAISDEPDSTRASNPGAQQGTTYYLEPNIFLLDVSRAPAVGGSGASVQGVGKVVTLDLMSVPMIKKAIEEDPDSGFKGQTKMIFVITKQVTLVQGAEELTDMPEGAEEGAEPAPEAGAEGEEAAADDSGAEAAPEGEGATQGAGSGGWDK